MSNRFNLPFADVGNGISPSSGAKLFFTATGTNDDLDTFSDVALSTANANPVVSDSTGVFADIFLGSGSIYRVVLKDKNNVQIWQADNVSASAVLKEVDTVAAMTALGSPIDGDKIRLHGYTTLGDNIARDYRWESASTTTANGGTVFAHDTVTPGRFLAEFNEIFVDDFGAVHNDGTTDQQTFFQAAETWRGANGGGSIGMYPKRQYVLGSKVDVGLAGNEVWFDGQDSKDGATIIAKTAFTGGLFVITQGGVKNCNGTGAGVNTSGHTFVYIGTALSTNPRLDLDNLLNNGGFYEFVSSDYEYDNGIIGTITSIVAIGHTPVRLQTGAGLAHSANPKIGPLFLRNPDSTPVVGTAKKYGAIIDRTEGAEIWGQCSNFDQGLRLGTTSALSNREVDINNFLSLDLRSTVSNDLWESAWAATTAYSLDDYRKPTAVNANGHFYIVTTAGTSGGTEPTWPLGHNATVVDGTVTWTEVGQSIGIEIIFNQQISLNHVRCEDGIVALESSTNSNIIVTNSRLVGEDTAILNAPANGNNAELIMENSLTSGDLRITSTAGAKIRFTGTNNLVTTPETAGEVPNHEGSSFSTGNYAFKAASGLDFTDNSSTDATSEILHKYTEGTWTPTVTAQTNTSAAAITTALFTVIGNKCFCGIRGTVTVTADNTESDFKFTLPAGFPMHSATISDVGGTIKLITGNADTAICTVASNTNGNATDVALTIPKKSIAVSGDTTGSLTFFGNFSYTIAT